jgi:NTE family protein
VATLLNELKARHIQKLHYETVLIMQGGGSLGAYECGVFKALYKNGIRFDIVAGTSIGAINAGIIAGSKNGDPAADLESFWLEVAERITPPFVLPDLPRAVLASAYSAFYGNPMVFVPTWLKIGCSLTFSLYGSPLYTT